MKKHNQSKKNRPMPVSHTYAVILAGGVGSRFWPLSRELEAKQFLSFGGDKTLFAQTIERISPLCKADKIIIVGSAQHKLPLEKHAEEFGIPMSNIILEPSGKNTAPAIALAAKHIHALDKNAIMVVLPADHYIRDTQKFLEIINGAVHAAQSGSLVTLGVTPTMPHTGYGYIKIKTHDSRLMTHDLKSKTKSKLVNTLTRITRKTTVYAVDRFVEKPNAKKAQIYFKDKSYYWNSGMFVWKVESILSEVKQCLPEVAKKIESINDARSIDAQIWNQIQSISIDYGVLEKSKHVLAIPTGDIGWSDLGSWSSIESIHTPDKKGNVLKGNIIDIDSKNIVVWGNSKRIAAIGLKDLVIVDTHEALLVCHKNHTEKVKKIVERINNHTAMF